MSIIIDTSWYNSTDTEFTLTKPSQLLGLSELSKTNTFTDITIKLGADIIFNELSQGESVEDWEVIAPGNVWQPIADGSVFFGGVFDGQGHTIKGLYTKRTDDRYACLFGLFGGTIKNVSVVNSYLETTYSSSDYHSAAGIVGRLANSVVIENVYTNAILKNAAYSGIAGVQSAGTGVTIKSCWFDGKIIVPTSAKSCGGMMATLLNNQTYILEDCLFTGTILGGGSNTYIGGLAGIGPYNAKLVVSNTLISGNMTGISAGIVGSVIGNNPGGNKSTYKNVYATNDTHTVLAGAGGTLSNFTASTVDKEEILGYKAYSILKGLDFSGVWITVKDKSPELRMFSTTKVPDINPEDGAIEWYGDGTAEEFIISTSNDLRGFSALSLMENFEGKTIKLSADIRMNAGKSTDWKENPPNVVWNPISSNSNVCFKGTFDGCGYVIAGLYNYAVEGATLGLFAYTEKATIKNLCLTNTYFSNEQVSTYHTHTGAIIGSAFGGAVENVYTDAILDGGHNLGMVAFFRNYNLEIRECWFDGTILPPKDQAFYAGGLVGRGFYHKDAKIHGGLLLENCLFTGTITGGTNGESSSFVGGLVGITPTGGENLPESKTKVVNCISSGSIMTDAADVGSLFGSCSWRTGYTELENVYAANETYINSEGSPQAMNPDRIGTTALVGTFELIPMEDLLGDKAKENATGLDYDSVWTTIEYKLPELINITKTPYKNKFSIDYSTMVDIIDKIRLRTNSNNKYTASSVPTGIDEVYEAGKSVGGSIVYVNAEEVSF